jgi:hypothetical protein
MKRVLWTLLTVPLLSGFVGCHCLCDPCSLLLNHRGRDMGMLNCCNDRCPVCGSKTCGGGGCGCTNCGTCLNCDGLGGTAYGCPTCSGSANFGSCAITPGHQSRTTRLPRRESSEHRPVVAAAGLRRTAAWDETENDKVGRCPTFPLFL